MKLRLMHKVEHWRENGAIGGIIETAEDKTGGELENYDEFIEGLSESVAAAIERAGHEVKWVYQQSRGVGCVVQNTEPEANDVFLAAVESCTAEFLAALIQTIDQNAPE